MSAEPIVGFTLTIAEYELLCKITTALHTLPDQYAQRVLRDHMFLVIAKARRKASREKVHRLEYDKLTSNAP